MSEETPLGVAAPAESFNFARHLIDLNTSRDAKLAYIDDGGACTYAELFRRVTRFADALIQLGLHREERLLLLAQDNQDWPVAFLGALYAGINPYPSIHSVSDIAYVLLIAVRVRDRGDLARRVSRSPGQIQDEARAHQVMGTATVLRT